MTNVKITPVFRISCRSINNASGGHKKSRDRNPLNEGSFVGKKWLYAVINVLRGHEGRRSVSSIDRFKDIYLYSIVVRKSAIGITFGSTRAGVLGAVSGPFSFFLRKRKVAKENNPFPVSFPLFPADEYRPSSAAARSGSFFVSSLKATVGSSPIECKLGTFLEELVIMARDDPIFFEEKLLRATVLLYRGAKYASSAHHGNVF